MNKTRIFIGGVAGLFVIILLIVSVYMLTVDGPDESNLDIDEYSISDTSYGNEYVELSNLGYALTSSSEGSIEILMPFEPEENLSDSYSELLKFKSKKGNDIYLFAKGMHTDNYATSVSNEKIQAETKTYRSTLSLLGLPIDENTQWSENFEDTNCKVDGMTCNKATGMIEDYKYSIYNFSKKYQKYAINLGAEMILLSSSASQDELDNIAEEILSSITK